MSHCSVPFWVEPCEGARIISSESKCMFALQLQRSYRLSAGCEGRVLGPIWLRAVLWRGSPYLVHAKLHPASFRERPSAPRLPSLQEALKCNRKGTAGDVGGFVLVLGPKAAQLSLVLRSVWPFSASSNWHFCLNFNRGMHLFLVLVEFHSFSVISFMIDLFNLFLFLPAPSSCVTVDFSCTINHVLLSTV